MEKTAKVLFMACLLTATSLGMFAAAPKTTPQSIEGGQYELARLTVNKSEKIAFMGDSHHGQHLRSVSN